MTFRLQAAPSTERPQCRTCLEHTKLLLIKKFLLLLPLLLPLCDFEAILCPLNLEEEPIQGSKRAIRNFKECYQRRKNFGHSDEEEFV